MQLIAPEVLRRCLIRESAKKCREPPHCSDVGSLRAGSEAADCHVLDHALAQWADGCICHGSAPLC